MSEGVGVPVPVEDMLPAVGQGAICIECRETDARVRGLLARIDHAETSVRIRAEHALLAELDGSCRTPIAGYAEMVADGRLRLRALVARPDGSQVLRGARTVAPGDAAAAGRDLGAELKGRAGPGFFDL